MNIFVCNGISRPPGNCPPLQSMDISSKICSGLKLGQENMTSLERIPFSHLVITLDFLCWYKLSQYSCQLPIYFVPKPDTLVCRFLHDCVSDPLGCPFDLAGPNDNCVTQLVTAPSSVWPPLFQSPVIWLLSASCALQQPLQSALTCTEGHPAPAHSF